MCVVTGASTVCSSAWREACAGRVSSYAIHTWQSQLPGVKTVAVHGGTEGEIEKRWNSGRLPKAIRLLTSFPAGG